MPPPTVAPTHGRGVCARGGDHGRGAGENGDVCQVTWSATGDRDGVRSRTCAVLVCLCTCGCDCLPLGGPRLFL